MTNIIKCTPDVEDQNSQIGSQNDTTMTTYVRMVYDYKSLRDDEKVCIRHGEVFRLVERSNSDWWYVENDDGSFGCYVPATFVKLDNSVGSLTSRSRIEEEIADCNKNENRNIVAAPRSKLVKTSENVQNQCDFKPSVSSPHEKSHHNQNDCVKGAGKIMSTDEVLLASGKSSKQMNMSQDFNEALCDLSIIKSAKKPLPNFVGDRKSYTNMSCVIPKSKSIASPKIRTSSFSDINERDKLTSVQPNISLHNDAVMRNLTFHKEGVLYIALLLENAMKVKKRWVSSWAILTGSQLLFYKDVSSSLSKPDVPRVVIELAGLQLSIPEKSLTKRKHVLKLVTRKGDVWLLQSTKRFTEWKIALDVAKDCACLQTHSESKVPVRQISRFIISQKRGVIESYSMRGVVQILNDFFKRRPSLLAVQAKGIFKNEPVFGSTLALIVEQEMTSRSTCVDNPAIHDIPIGVPLFIVRCIEAIEKRGGLVSEGIYRVAGNAATVQKLRCIVDQSTNYNLEEVQWELNVLTSALKTFFRELKEPLIPFNCYHQLLDAYCNFSVKPRAKLNAMCNILSTMPTVNYKTMKILFQHLYRVLENCRVNQMNSHNLAMMFGPNIMWMEQATVDLTTSLVQQNQITEFFIIETPQIFAD